MENTVFCEGFAFSESQYMISGYRFETEKDEHVCEKCRLLNGKIYRLPSDELPELPLHPNCRCRLVPLGRRSLGH